MEQYRRAYVGAVVASTVINMLKSGGPHVEPEELISSAPSRKAPWEAQLETVETLNRLFGGKDLRN